MDKLRVGLVSVVKFWWWSEIKDDLPVQKRNRTFWFEDFLLITSLLPPVGVIEEKEVKLRSITEMLVNFQDAHPFWAAGL